jgi:hypothetical protein
MSIREASDQIGHNIQTALIKLGIKKRYFGEHPYPDQFNRVVLKECLSFHTKEERDRVYNAFCNALQGWAGELSIVCADDFGSDDSYYKFDLDLSISARPRVKTLDQAFEIMVQVSEKIVQAVTSIA